MILMPESGIHIKDWHTCHRFLSALYIHNVASVEDGDNAAVSEVKLPPEDIQDVTWDT